MIKRYKKSFKGYEIQDEFVSLLMNSKTKKKFAMQISHFKNDDIASITIKTQSIPKPFFAFIMGIMFA